MGKLNFETWISASSGKVWSVLFDEKTYGKWTEVFSAGSTAKTDWKKGSKVHFLNGTGEGMYALIEENIPQKFLSIKHLGEVKDGKEGPLQDWGDAHEDYHLEEKDGGTLLKVEMGIPEEWREYFEKTWPQALETVKSLSEQ